MLTEKYHDARVPCSSAGHCNPWEGNRRMNPSTNDADLAKEMNELSFEEREQILDDIHGVAKLQEETPEFINMCIAQMNAALVAIPLRQKRDYNRALFLWPGLETDVKFKLMFLRADGYHPENAARRLVNYYGQKRIVFGEDKLVKTITMDDLTDKDLDAFRTGFIGELPIKDQTGRPVFFYDCSNFDTSRMSLENIIRAWWYQFMSAFADETTQIKGACAINPFFAAGIQKSGSILKVTEAVMRTGFLFKSCLPGRFTSFHVCYDNPRMTPLLSTIRMAVGKSTRLRLRAHIGSDVENEYQLMTFGIHCDGVIQGARMGSKLLNKEYMERRKEIDKRNKIIEYAEASKAGFVPCPSSSDVIFGRGRPYRDFAGNQPWNDLIDSYMDQYRESNTRFDKTCVTMDVVRKIRESNVRFLLERSGDGWKILNDSCIREKAAAAFQNRVKSMSRNNDASSPSGSTSSSSAGNPAKRQRC